MILQITSTSNSAGNYDKDLIQNPNPLTHHRFSICKNFKYIF